MTDERDPSAGGGFAATAPAGTLEHLILGILDNCLFNIIHEEVLTVHCSEKKLRAQSAAAQAELVAAAQIADAPNPTKGPGPPLPAGRAETSAAVYENGRVSLKGNPLKTTSNIVCPHCKLPRLMYPHTGVGSRIPDLTKYKEFCTKHPFVVRSGHDIYNQPFPTDMAKTKKERELLKQQQRAEKDNTPGSQDTSTPPENNLNSLMNPNAKPASYIPWHTCPNCKRSLLITRFAHHAEKCIAGNGRQSSRNAMAKLNCQNGNTPLGSRMGTPVPGSQGLTKRSPIKRGDGDEEDGEDVDTPKKKKKSSYIKKADRERMGMGPKLKLHMGAKRSPKPPGTEGSDAGDKTERTDGVKRDREDAEGEIPRKKIKLIKEANTMSDAKNSGASNGNSAATTAA